MNPLAFQASIPELAPEREFPVDHALDRIRTASALRHLAGLVPTAPHHRLYEVEAARIREVGAEERLPNSLLSVVVQFFLPLESDEVNLFPSDVAVGPNLLGPDAPTQGLLGPAIVRGQGPSGRAGEARGALFVPGFVGLPIRVSGALGVPEVVVYVGSKSIVGGFHDPRGDSLVVDLMG